MREVAPDMGKVYHESPMSEVERVNLPDHVIAELEGNEEHSPLRLMVKELSEAGVSDRDIEEYQRAVREFLHHRPTTVLHGNEMGFGSAKAYFEAQVTLPANRHVFGDVIGNFPDGFYEVSNGEVRKEITEADAGELLERVLGQGDERKENVSQPERLAIELNRLMYSFHEPFHIAGGVAKGDQWNNLKRSAQFEDVVDVDKEKAIVRQMGEEVFGGIADSEFENVDGTVWDLIQRTPKRPREYGMQEATIDVMSEIALREYLRKKTDVLLQLHNTLAGVFAAMNHLRSELIQDRTWDRGEKKALDQKVLWLEESLGIIEQPYFAAFDTAQEGVAFLEEVRGGDDSAIPILDVRFDRFDVWNIFSDVQNRQRLLTGGDKKKISEGMVEDENGFVVGGDRDVLPPLKKEAAAIFGRLMEGARNKGLKKGVDLFELMKKIDVAVEAGEALDGVVGNISDTLGVDLSVEDARALYGIENYYPPNLDNVFAYAKSRAFHKDLFLGLPDEQATLRKLVVSKVEKFDYSDFNRLIGFTIGWEGDRHKVPWEQVMNETALGIFGIDVPKMRPAYKTTLRGFFEEFGGAGREGVSKERQQWVLTWLAERKREQNELST